MYALKNNSTAKQGHAANSLQKKKVTQLRLLPAVPALQKQAAPVVQRIEDPANKQKALDLHKADQDRVYKIIDDAAATDLPAAAKPTRAKLLKNTAELVKNGFATLIVMTRTHAAPALRSDGEIGYFDLSIKYPTKGGDYNLAQDDHIYMAPANISGHADHRGEIRFYDPSGVSDENLQTVLIHEMQHQADFHNPGEAYTQPAVEGANAQALNGYQTEFRAYWLGGVYRTRERLGTSYDELGFSSLDADNSKKVPSGSIFTSNYTTAFKNLRQQNIFWHIIGSSAYTYILTAYQNSAAFRDMVHNFTLPVGGNLLNSIRIDNLRRSILTLASKKKNQTKFLTEIDYDMPHDEYEERRKSLKDAINTAIERVEELRALLDREDIEFLNDKKQSAPFWAFADEKMGGALSGELYEFLTYRRIQIRRAELGL